MKQSSYYQWQDDTLLLYVQALPRASKDEIVGPQGDYLKIRITAPPIEGKANQHLVKYLSKVFATPRSRISLLKGESSRIKCLTIDQPRQLPECIPPKTETQFSKNARPDYI